MSGTVASIAYNELNGQRRELIANAVGNGVRMRVVHQSMLTMYTTTWCGFCARLKAQLAREGIDYNEVDIDRDDAAAELVMTVNGGNRTVPTLVFANGNSLTNPSVAEVKAQLAA